MHQSWSVESVEEADLHLVGILSPEVKLLQRAITEANHVLGYRWAYDLVFRVLSLNSKVEGLEFKGNG
jgi:hypothetical protein